MFRSALLILSGNVTASVLSLARNLVVARLLAVEDYGIAATLMIAVAVIEMLSAFGLQQQIIQSRRGNDPALQAGLHGFQAFRGLMSGAILFALAWPMAAFLGIPEAAWAYHLMALVPVMSGFMHLDIHRLNRRMVYLPAFLTSTVPAIAGFAAIWPLWLIWPDYRVMLFSILIQHLVGLVMSHRVAERPYRLAFDRKVVLGTMQFGWPLLINNILLFAVLHGEKLIVGRELGMAALAIFAMGFTLTLTPTLVMAKTVQTFFLPQLSAAQDDPARFEPLARAMLQAAILNGLAMLTAVVLLGGPLVSVVLGEKFAPLLPLLTWFAILQALRILKAGNAVVALARGRTGNAMAGNIPRLISLPLSWYVLHLGGDLMTVIAIGIAAEAVGAAVSLQLLSRRVGLPLRPMRLSFAAAALVFAGGAAHAVMTALAPQDAWMAGAATAAAFLIAVVAMRDVRRYVRRRDVTRFEDEE